MLRAFLLALMSAAAVAAAPVPEDDAAARLQRQYGTWVCQEPACKYTLSGDVLRVKLPAGGVSYHWGGKTLGPAPRVLKEVTGDFEAVVRVRAAFPERVKGNGQPSARGGLIAVNDGPDMRAILWGLGWVSGKPEGFMQLEGGDNRIGFRGRGFDTAADSAYVRLKRDGNSIQTAWSRDRKDWSGFTPTPVSWGDKVKVGLLAESGLADPTEVTFDRYSLTQPKK